MKTDELYSRMALERCRVYLAQLSAASYFSAEDQGEVYLEVDTISHLIRGLYNNLEILERSFDARQG